METYKNSYSIKEDEVLWELHEIRRKIHEELKTRPLDEINRAAHESFAKWQRDDACASGADGKCSEISG